MDQFRNFLGGTAGRDMLQFWIDCEKFKDVMEDFDDLELMVTRNRLYRLPLTIFTPHIVSLRLHYSFCRDIKDKYKVSLTLEARRQIQQAAHDRELSNTVFIRTQYDVLRRLRTYWISRFLIHKERLNELRWV